MRGLSTLLCAAALLASAYPALAAPPCRPAERALPAGVLGEGGCVAQRRPAQRMEAVPKTRDQGFIDFGNGTELRVGGRVRVEGETRR